MYSLIRILLPAVLAILGWVPGALGQAGIPSTLATVRFLEGWASPSGDVHTGGIQISLARGWKTYWRAPGEFGIPPRLELSRSENIRGVFMHFPRPTIYFDNDVRTIGYADKVVFPLDFFPDRAGSGMRAHADLHLGVCREVCVPVSFQFPIMLSNRKTTPPVEIVRALRMGPNRIDATGGAVRIRCRLTRRSPPHGYQVTYDFDHSRPMSPLAAAVFEYPGQPVWFSDARLSRRPNGMVSATAQMEYFGTGPFFLDRSQLRMTLISGRDYLEFSGCHSDGADR